MSECKQYAQVIVDVPIRAADQLYDYIVPPELVTRVTVGKLVCVPFGNVVRVGYVVGISLHSEISELKPIASVIDDEPTIDDGMISLCRWVADRYAAPLPEGLRLGVPPGRHRRRAGVRPAIRPKTTRFARLVGEVDAAGSKQRRLLELLGENAELPVDELLKAAGATGASLRSLVAKGAVQVEERRCERKPVELYREDPVTVTLTPTQQAAVERIEQALAGRPEVFLMEGVTGSGKTEIYVRAVAAVLSRGRSAIVLVPEIALTPQIIARFRNRFGGEVAVLHSALGAGERYDQWTMVASGAHRIVVGARSAVFAPVKDLGLIVVDEEHESTYKQNRSPRYNARDVAIERARCAGATVILGSATPSLESRWAAEEGVFGHVRLAERVAGGKAPEIQVVDMRRQFDPLSPTLISRLRECLSAGGKAILFLNRRGFSQFVLCADCGHVPKCPACAISLTYHRAEHALKCHYCGFLKAAGTVCPACGGNRVRYPGIGTQRVEQELRAIFDGTPIIRMDADTTVRKGSHERALLRFRSSDKAILLGTQMIAKGLDFPEVTLVGVVDADVALHLPDFRAAERTFQLLMQVSGRAGRGSEPGRVVIQTYAPESFPIRACVDGDYEEFFRRELEDRRELVYPPMCRLVRVVVAGADPGWVEARASEVRDLVAAAGLPDVIAVLGPSPAPLPRLRGHWRWHIIIKVAREFSESADGERALTVVRFLKDNLDGSSSRRAGTSERRSGSPIMRDVNCLIDVDPQWVL